jgi:hypothetical protein
VSFILNQLRPSPDVYEPQGEREVDSQINAGVLARRRRKGWLAHNKQISTLHSRKQDRKGII